MRSLRASGSIDSATAVKLLLKARITESQAAAQLQISPASTTAEVDTTGTGTATAPAQPPQHGAQPQSTSETPPGTPQTATPVAPANQPATAQTVVAAITRGSMESLALKPGDKVTVIIKATEVLIGK